MMKKLFVSIFFLIVVGMLGYFIFNKNQPEDSQLSSLTETILSPTPLPNIISATKDVIKEKDGFKTFTFDNFHGSTDIGDKFTFQYPANWYNDGQYFSPEKIQFYDLYSVKAPVYFDLILAKIFHQTEFSFYINTSQRRSPDMAGQIDGKEFQRYDLIDSGSYGGESAGRVKIFVGPMIKIDGENYFLVFHWEEKPLAEDMPSNDVKVFDNMLLTLKFFK